MKKQTVPIRALLREKKGLTIVEVLVAFTIMLLMISVFWGAVSFSHRAQGKAAEIRGTATELARILREEMKASYPAQPDGAPQAYEFKVVGGSSVQFVLHAQKVTRSIPLADGSTIVVAQFQVPEGGGAP